MATVISHDGDDNVGVNDPSIRVNNDLVGLPEYKDPGITSVDFNGLLQSPLLLYEDASEGCGGHTWPAGMVLAKYLIRQPTIEFLRGKKILELGAGSGLVGLAIARALSGLASSDGGSQSYVEMTDQAAMIDLMRKNINLNGFASDLISASVLDWGKPINGQPPADVILAAECVYFEPAFPLLINTLAQLIGQDTVCYFCFKKRRRADMRFVKDARKRFVVEDIGDDPDKPIWSRDNLFFYKITRKL